MKQFQQSTNSAILTLMSLVVMAPGVAIAQGPQKELIEATRLGDVATVKRLLADGVSANTKNDEGVTALMLASASGDTGVTTLLIAHGAEINATAENGWTAVIKAAGGDASPDEALRNWTALMAAAALGRAGVVKLLLAKGAEPRL